MNKKSYRGFTILGMNLTKGFWNSVVQLFCLAIVSGVIFAIVWRYMIH
jgi:hypothetical protein